MKTKAKRVIELREDFRSKARALHTLTRFPSEREEQWTLGRIQTLERIADELAAIEEGVSAVRVQARLESLINLLAEHKATWIANYIHDRRRFGINELGQWQAEGSISQIDAAVVRLCPLLPIVWRLSEKQYGRYFRVYHCNGCAEEVAKEQEKGRWLGNEQERWYTEVAIVQVEEAAAQVERASYVTSRPGWWESKRGVFWIRQGFSHRLTLTGDIIVSVLSQTAWLVCGTRFEIIEPEEKGVRA